MAEGLEMGANVEAVIAVWRKIIIAFEKERVGIETVKYLEDYEASKLCRERGIRYYGCRIIWLKTPITESAKKQESF